MGGLAFIAAQGLGLEPPVLVRLCSTMPHSMSGNMLCTHDVGTASASLHTHHELSFGSRLGELVREAGVMCVAWCGWKAHDTRVHGTCCFFLQV